MNNLQQRTAVGEEARIGAFYNARDDSFLTGSFFEKQYFPEAVEVNSTPSLKVELNNDRSYESKFRMLGVDSPLAATILAQWLDCKGSFRVLEELRSHDNAWSALYHTSLTVEEKLNLSCPAIRDRLKNQSLHDVTHIVTKVKWGLRTIITAECPQGPIASEEDFLKSQMDALAAAAEQLPSNSGQELCHFPGPESSDKPLDVTVYSDVLQTNGIIMKDIREAYDFLQILPLHIKDNNAGKGKPVVYSLIPIEYVGYMIPLPLEPQTQLLLPRNEILNAFIKVFDRFQSCRRQLLNQISYAASKKQYVLPGQAESFKSRLQQLSDAETSLKAQFPVALRNARHGDDQRELDQLLRQFEGGSSPGKIAAIDPSELDALRILDELVSKGATYVGADDSILSQELQRYSHGKAYVFCFDRSDMADAADESRAPNYDRYLKLLDNRNEETLYAIYDFEAKGDASDNGSHISRFENGEKITQDLLKHESSMKEKCFARCSSNSLETDDITRPIKRRFVTMPCPSTQCNDQLDCHWICSRCQDSIEYGVSDNYFYCNCGRSKFSNYKFKCNSASHGPGFFRPDCAPMLKQLGNLGSSDYVNVLILGETGVGKSTFINAMINYLQFETLDDAMASEALQCVVPCSFFTQCMSREDPDNEIKEHFISVGSREDEMDGSKGNSATQQTNVYCVTVRSGSTSYTVRLIDTPGIGDTRGPDFDEKNMTDILTTMSNYDELHGILILLKPNNSRLTVTFQYCVKQLLVHLHQNAARNMVFGFTNTRITNYTPGDTFQPLKRLLGENSNVGLSLSTKTTYCFDSESFRYLAASKKAVDMPNKDDFDRSWKHSRDETERLITHFRSVSPHLTKSTMSLNGVRRSIEELTKPMAEISQIIRKNVALCTDQKAELEDKQLTGDQLLNNLHIQKIQLMSEQLDQPRTVCAHRRCTEFRDDGTGRNEKVTIYKTHCHPSCHLQNVPHDVLAPPELINCTAFKGSDCCRRCGHHWSEHMHVLYELKEHTVIVKDSTVEQQLKDHADDITLHQTAIENRIRTILEYQREREIIRDATVKFGVFLKHHSITPINDAMEAYLHSLIKAEQDKVHVGGNDAELQALTEDLQRHKEAMQVMIRTLNTSTTTTDDDLTESGIGRIIGTLYNLKHFGKNLESLRQGISFAHEATNREIPVTVRRNPVNESGRRPMKLESRRNNQALGSAGGGGAASIAAKFVQKGLSLFT